MYCLKCKKDTKDLNVKAFMTKNNRYMLKSTCDICKGKKSKFVSKKEIMGDQGSYQISFQKYQY